MRQLINGFFQLIPYNYKISGNHRITGIIGSTTGAEVFEKGQLWPPTKTQMQANVGTIILNKVNRFFNSVISNEWVDFGQSKNFNGWNSVEAYNTTIQGNGNTGGLANFTARQEVHLTSEFKAKKGCEAHFYISETFADCDDYSTFQTVYKPTGALSLSPEKSREDIRLQFQIPLQDIVIIPNPNSGGFKLTLTTETTDQCFKITIQNVHGKKVKQFLMDKKELFIDLSVLAKGIYFLSIAGNTSLETKKLIIQ